MTTSAPASTDPGSSEWHALERQAAFAKLRSEEDDGLRTTRAEDVVGDADDPLEVELTFVG